MIKGLTKREEQMTNREDALILQPLVRRLVEDKVEEDIAIEFLKSITYPNPNHSSKVYRISPLYRHLQIHFKQLSME
jgi:hypothetical protein